MTANVTSIDALRGLRAALVRFKADIETALTTLELEARRPVEWIEGDRSRYWPQQAHKAAELVSQARLALERCQLRISSEDTRHCYDERQALDKARRRQQLAEDKTQAVRRWRVEMHKGAEDFQTQLARLKQYLENDLARAVAMLDRITTALDRYAEPNKPSLSAPSGPTVPLTTDH